MFSALQQRPQAQWFPEMLAFMFSGPGLSHKLWLIVRQQEYPLSKELNKIQILCSNNKKKKTILQPGELGGFSCYLDFNSCCKYAMTSSHEHFENNI